LLRERGFIGPLQLVRDTFQRATILAAAVVTSETGSLGELRFSFVGYFLLRAFRTACAEVVLALLPG